MLGRRQVCAISEIDSSEITGCVLRADQARVGFLLCRSTSTFNVALFGRTCRMPAIPSGFQAEAGALNRRGHSWSVDCVLAMGREIQPGLKALLSR